MSWLDFDGPAGVIVNDADSFRIFAGNVVSLRRDPRVLKLHIPMPHRFLPVFHRSAIQYDIPGIFRVGSTEIRLPGAIRYVDGISGVGSP